MLGTQPARHPYLVFVFLHKVFILPRDDGRIASDGVGMASYLPMLTSVFVRSLVDRQTTSIHIAKSQRPPLSSVTVVIVPSKLGSSSYKRA
jgi:hypothetical protein